jgi:predicted MPP superfamily phosphohydrolase
MVAKACSDEEFIKLFKELGSPQKISEHLGVSVRTVYTRRNNLEKKYGISLMSYDKTKLKIDNIVHEQKAYVELSDGIIVVFSDAHYWPGPATVAHKALLEVLKNLPVDVVVANGDVFDGAKVSRHDPLYKQNTPSPKEELEACQERLGEIEKACKNAKKLWTYGNHDTRLWRYIRMNAPEISGMPHTDLYDYFPSWHTCYAIDVNGNTVIKHRWHNGIHSTYNNALRSGVNFVTGHLHRLQVTAWGDYTGRRYGVDTGCLAEPDGPQFMYLEHNPTPWASGFAVLTYRNGVLLPPELCEVVNGEAFFRSCKIA